MIKLKNILLEVLTSISPIEDFPKKKMGGMWFKRWMTPKKEKAGWKWKDDGKYIWVTRPGSPKPTARYEKETGLLQGHWVDNMEYQW